MYNIRVLNKPNTSTWSHTHTHTCLLYKPKIVLFALLVQIYFYAQVQTEKCKHKTSYHFKLTLTIHISNTNNTAIRLDNGLNYGCCDSLSKVKKKKKKKKNKQNWSSLWEGHTQCFNLCQTLWYAIKMSALTECCLLLSLIISMHNCMVVNATCTVILCSILKAKFSNENSNNVIVL